MTGPRSDFVSGARAMLPVTPANAAFGVIVGVATFQASGSLAETVVFSMVMFSGAAQLAAIDLFRDGAPIAIALVTALLVNLRYVMYSAGMAPYTRSLPARWKAVVSAVLIDLTFAASISRFGREREVDHGWYVLGTAAPIWVSWLSGITTGALLGTDLPGWLSLEFTFPLMFLAMVFPAIEGRYTAIAAVVAGVLVVVTAGLPMNLGLVVASLAGVAAGTVLEGRAAA